MSNFTIEQFVEHANQYEAMPEGEFDTEQAALSAMQELSTVCGFTDMRVVNSDGEVVARALMDCEITTIIINTYAPDSRFDMTNEEATRFFDYVARMATKAGYKYEFTEALSVDEESERFVEKCFQDY